MRFILKYFIDSVAVELGVDSDTAEQAEVLLKKCIAKMLRSFPVGQLFVGLTPILDQQQFWGMQQGNIWAGEAALGMGAPAPPALPGWNSGPNTTIPMTTNGNTFTAGGVFTADGAVHFNMNNSSPLPPGAGVFSVTVTNSSGEWVPFSQDNGTENHG